MRIKRGTAKRRKHNKVLKMTKGYRLSYSKLYRRAKEAARHAGQYSFAHRKKRQGQFRALWIKKINAALSTEGVSYNKFINGLKTAKIELDRKVLANIAVNYPEVFKEVVAKTK